MSKPLRLGYTCAICRYCRANLSRGAIRRKCKEKSSRAYNKTRTHLHYFSKLLRLLTLLFQFLTHVPDHCVSKLRRILLAHDHALLSRGVLKRWRGLPEICV